VPVDAALMTIAEKSMLWHRRLGHRNDESIKRLCSKEVGIPQDFQGEETCNVCKLSKHTMTSFPRSCDRKAIIPFELVHIDLVGPIEVELLGGAKYAMVIIDEYSRWLTVYGLSSKSQSFNTFKQYLLDVQAMGSGHRVKGIRSDNAAEFRSNEFQQLCKSKGIRQSYSGPYAPQQMGLVERANRTLFDMVRCLLMQAKLNKELWGEAVNTAAYIINRFT